MHRSRKPPGPPSNTPGAIWDDQLRCWVSDAQVAEIPYTAFTSKKNKAITARLIVRRVKDLNRKAGEGQDELFPVWRYHAVFTDSPFTLLQAEEHHRDHAQAEQVFADWGDGPLAHLPSGVKGGRGRRIYVSDELERLYGDYLWELAERAGQAGCEVSDEWFCFVNLDGEPRFAPLRPERVYRVTGRLRRELPGLPQGWSPHWLRHTHASTR